MKTCKKCGESKALDQFLFQMGRRKAVCRTCNNAAINAWKIANKDRDSAKKVATQLNHWKVKPLIMLRNRLYYSSKARATKRGLLFELTKPWIMERLETGLCSVTGLPFVFEQGSPFMPSLDQIDPGEGYTMANTQVVAWIYNAAKQDWGHNAVVELAKALNG